MTLLHRSRPRPAAARRLSLTVALAFCLLLGSSPAFAAVPPPPDVAAIRAFVGDPLWGLAPGDPGSLYGVNSVSAAGNASTTKTFTLLLAAEAIEAGDVTLDTTVTITDSALRIGTGHGTLVGDFGEQLAEGDQFRLEDALHAMFITSAGNLTIAIAETIAGSEQAFVSLMNARAAELGLQDTIFANPYGGDHGHAADGTDTGPVVHETSARDLASWFTFALTNDTFRDIMSFQGTYTFTNLDFNTSYSLSWTPGYPGTVAAKGGNNEACAQCLVFVAERLGRELVATYLQGQGGDGTLLMDHGFAITFLPQQRGTSAAWGEVTRHDITCLSPGYAASAVVTPAGDTELAVWSPDVDAATIGLAGQSAAPAAAFAQGPTDTLGGPADPGDDTGRGPRPEDPPPAGDGDEPSDPPTREPQPERTDEPTEQPTEGPSEESDETVSGQEAPSGSVVSPDGGAGTPGAGGGAADDVATAHVDTVQVSVADNGAGLVVTAEQKENGSINLLLHAISPAGAPTLSDLRVAADGTDPRVIALAANRVALSYIDAIGIVHLQTWGLDTDALELSPMPLDDLGYATGSEHDLAARPAAGAAHILALSYVNGSGNLVVANARVAPSGDILAQGTASFSAASHVAIQRVRDEDPLFAVAYRTAAGALAVDGIRLPATGGVLQAGSATTDAPVSATGAIDIAGYDHGGVLVAHTEATSDPETTLTVFSLDPNGSGTYFTQEVVDQVAAPGIGAPALCRLPDDRAEGDFILAQQDFFSAAVGVTAWRSGARPAGYVPDVDAGGDGHGVSGTVGLADELTVSVPAPADTAIALSRLTHAAGTVDTVLLAGTHAFPDALASGALQGQLGAALLLTDPSAPSPGVLEEIRRLGATRVVILGGVAAISPAVVDALPDDLLVERRAGATRIGTAAVLADDLGSATGVLITRAFAGEDPTQAFADSIALGAWAAAQGWPVLLTTADALSPEVADLLASGRFLQARVIGGTAAVSDVVLAEIAALVPDTARVAGDTRFDTAAAIASARGFTPSTAPRVVLADGAGAQAWAAGFAAAGLAAGADRGDPAPILLSSGESLPQTTIDWLQAARGRHVELVCATTGPACNSAASLLAD